MFGILEIMTENRDRNIVLFKLRNAITESYNLKPLEKEEISSIVRKWEKVD